VTGRRCSTALLGLAGALALLLPLSTSAQPQPQPQPQPLQQSRPAAAASSTAPRAPELVAAIGFPGAEYFREQTLRRMIRSRENAPLDLSQVAADAIAIEENYRLRGFLRARVRSDVQRAAGQVSVLFRIRTGERAKVRRLLVQGNHALTDAEATEGLFTKPDELFGALKQAGVFHAKRLDKDLQTVARNYYRRGYLQAQVQRWRARATPSADAIDVSIDVEEGPLFHIGDIELAGELPAAEPELQVALGLERGDVANLVALGEGLERVLDLWRERGYPFPRAVQSPRIDAAQHLFDARIEIQHGSEARVGEIRVRGEPWSARRVIVRDLDFAPGDLYDLGALRRSRQRLLASGLFTEAVLEPVATADPTLVDVEIEVTERPGIIKDCIFNIAPAYFQSEGLIGVGILICPNFVGQGQRVSAIGQLSSLRQLFDVSFVEPRLVDSRFSLSTGAHRRRLVYPLFSTDTLGAEVGLARELVWGVQASIGYELERVDVEPVAALAPFARGLRFPYGSARSAVRARISHDTRSRGLTPGPGSYHSLSLSSSGFWTLGEISFVEVRGIARYYLPLPLDALLKLNLSAGSVFDPTGRPVVVSERYFLGGFGSVRGYRPRSIGPTLRYGDPSDPGAPAVALALGGVHEVLANLELELPLIKEWDLKGFAFLDAGNAFDEDEDFLLWGAWETAREVPLPLGMYSSVGLGLLLPTGTLPIRLEWSMPLTRRPGDPEIDFFFGVGGMF